MKAFHKSVYLLCLLSLVGSLLLSVGVTTARYRTSVDGSLSFLAKTAEQTGSLSLVSPQGWTTTASGASVTFAVAPVKDAADRTAYVRLTATELAGENVTVTLIADGKTYTATPRRLTAGDWLFAQMGKGTEYRFYDGKTELEWPLSDERQMTMSVSGVADVSLLRLVAVETQG